MWENTRVTEDSTPHNSLNNKFVTDCINWSENFQALAYIIQGESLAKGPKLLSIKIYVIEIIT